MEYLIGAGITLLAIALVYRWLSKRSNDVLELELQSHLLQARRLLSKADHQRLVAHLLELRETGLSEAANKGWSGATASRHMKLAAVQSIKGYLEIDKMFGATDSKAAI